VPAVSATAASAAEQGRRFGPGWVYGSAAILLLAAVVLAVADFGEKPGRLDN